MTKKEFSVLLHQLADAWTMRDYSKAVSCFASDIRYADPLRYRFQGREELLRFFSNDDDCSQEITWHTLLFDEEMQVGMAEYTYCGTHRYHGVALIKIRDGLISHWREYQHTSDLDWTAFTADT